MASGGQKGIHQIYREKSNTNTVPIKGTFKKVNLKFSARRKLQVCNWTSGSCVLFWFSTIWFCEGYEVMHRNNDAWGQILN